MEDRRGSEWNSPKKEQLAERCSEKEPWTTREGWDQAQLGHGQLCGPGRVSYLI